MGIAYQCDRCSQFFPDKPAAEITLRPRLEEGQTKFVRDVCEDCSTKIRNFITYNESSSDVAVVLAMNNLGHDPKCEPCITLAMTGHLSSGIHTCDTILAKRRVFLAFELLKKHSSSLIISKWAEACKELGFDAETLVDIGSAKSIAMGSDEAR